MTNKARLTHLGSQLVTSSKGGEPQAVIANHPHGGKGDYIKLTVTIPPELYSVMAQEATRRKIAKEPHAQLSAIIREALVTHFKLN